MPTRWDLAANLETWQVGDLEDWTLSRYANEVADGDDVVLFAAGTHGGVLALGEIAGEPGLRRRPEFRGEGPDDEPTIDVRLKRILRPPVTREQLKSHPVLKDLAVLRFANATNFKVTNEEWDALMELIETPSASSRCVVVYVGKSSEPNFAFSSPDGRWGWKTWHPDYSRITPGDRILFGLGFTGGSPRMNPDDFQSHRFARIVEGRVTSAVTEERDPYWPDESGDLSYPYRIEFERVSEDELVQIEDLDHEYGGPVGDAFRLSGIDKQRGVVVDTAIALPPEDYRSLEEVVEQFAEALRVAGYSYGGARHDELVRTFVTSLATKRLVILTGLSGSGKTKLAQNFGEWLGKDRLRIIAVRPDWTNPDPLLGYENGLSELTSEGYAWNVPDALQFVLRALQHPTEPHLLLLDEMNLAHVERYFADVLSGIESNHGIIPNLVQKDGSWRLVSKGPARLPFPRNVFVVGTVNIDETTYMFSPKVLDRANTIEFRVATGDLQTAVTPESTLPTANSSLVAAFLDAATRPAAHTEAGSRVASWLRVLHARLSIHGREFGHRTFAESMRFAELLAQAGEPDPLVALDLQVLQKVLPKYHGSVRELSDALNDLGAWCFAGPEGPMPEPFDAASPPASEASLPRSFDKVHRMAKRLRANHFVSFAE